MELTLDYNHEIFPLTVGQNVVLALASSLARDSGGTQDGAIEDERDRDVWRPDGKGKRGFEDEYDYVMYGRVYRFDPGTGEVVCVPLAFSSTPTFTFATVYLQCAARPSGPRTHRLAGCSCLSRCLSVT
jgi:hypothetical protein